MDAQRSTTAAVEAPPLTLREEQKRLTRNRIIDSARRAFAENGYASTSIDDIVRVAGVSRGTFYLHFKNRSEVLAELFQVGHLDAATELARRMGEIEEVDLASIESWISDFIALYEDTKDVLAAWYQGDPRERKELALVRDKFSSQFLEVLGKQIVDLRSKQRRRTTADEARLRAFLIFVQLERFCYYYVIHDFDFDRKKSIQLLARSWLELMEA
jgi:AcrR family transcriptional regulator